MNDFLAGAVSGVFQTFVGFPFDTYKVILQHEKRSVSSLLRMNPFIGIQYPMISSVMNCSITFGVNKYLKNEHGFKSYQSGFISGICISPIIYVFDTFKVKSQTRTTQKSPPILNHLLYGKGKIATVSRESFAFSVYFSIYDYVRAHGLNVYLSGALAGLANWTTTYPIDVIKTRQLTQNIGIIPALKQGNLWRGYTPCAIRAVIVNGVGFYVYEQALKVF